MIVSFTPSELLELSANGLDDTAFESIATWPAVVVDLNPAFEPIDLVRLTRLTETAPCVLLGMAASAADVDESVLGLDVLVCADESASAPWVARGGALDETVEALLASISASPDAAVAFAQLLRVGEHASASEAVVAESWVYSLLQSGTRYQEWLASRASRTKRPRPDQPVVRVERVGDVVIVTLDRPEVHNAFGARMRDELVEAFRLADVDRSIDRVLVRGNGPSFCSGGDLDEFGTAPAPVDAHSIRTRRNAGVALSAIADRVEVHVHGTCVGAGVELPAFAGRVIAHPDTTFLLPEVSMGLVPGAGGTSSIPRRIGRHRAAYIGLIGRPFDANTALRWGLIDAIDVIDEREIDDGN